MFYAFPLTLIPFLLFNIIGYIAGGSPWGNEIFAVPMVGGLWTITVDHSSRRGIAGTPMPPWAARAWAGHQTPSCRSW